MFKLKLPKGITVTLASFKWTGRAPLRQPEKKPGAGTVRRGLFRRRK